MKLLHVCAMARSTGLDSLRDNDNFSSPSISKTTCSRFNLPCQYWAMTRKIGLSDTSIIAGRSYSSSVYPPIYFVTIER